MISMEFIESRSERSCFYSISADSESCLIEFTIQSANQFQVLHSGFESQFYHSAQFYGKHYLLSKHSRSDFLIWEHASNDNWKVVKVTTSRDSSSPITALLGLPIQDVLLVNHCHQFGFYFIFPMGLNCLFLLILFISTFMQYFWPFLSSDKKPGWTKRWHTDLALGDIC